MADVGRPPLFTFEEDCQKMIDRYFSENKTKPTITGLALYMGFASRQSFYDYEKSGEFSYTIKRARLRIENKYEEALHGTSPTGAIFALKNFGWTDKQEIDQKIEHSGSLAFNGIQVINPNDKASKSEDIPARSDSEAV